MAFEATIWNKISWLFLHHYVIFHLFIHGNSRYLFPKYWNWQICHTQQAIKLPLSTFSGKLRMFSMVKSKTVGFLLVYSSSLCKNSSWVTSGKRAAKQPLCGLFWGSCTWFHHERFENCWKCLAEWRLVLETCVLHHALVKKSKDKTECCCKDQYKSKPTHWYWCIITFEGPALFTYIQLASCLWYDNACPRGNLGSARKTAGPSP